MRYKEELTKEKALEYHRQLWNYIADESERTGKPVNKKQAFIHFGWSLRTKSLCWCCEYCGAHCYMCPVEWPGNDGCLCSAKSPYYKLTLAEDFYNMYKNDYPDHRKAVKCLNDYIKYAREIANLPERKGWPYNG